MRVLNAEGWTFTADEVRRMLRLGGGLVLDLNGAPTGMLTLITHARLAWIGNVAVLPEARGKGLGARLVEDALAVAAARGAETVGLYSVLAAVSLYRRQGFREGPRVLSLHGEGRGGSRPARVLPLAPWRLGDVARFDATRAGDDRSRMLRVLAESFPATSFVLEDPSGTLRGYGIVKTSASGAEIGPLVVEAGDDDALATLYDAALAALPPGAPVEVGVHESNDAALALLRARGFAPAFPAVAMHHGARGHEGEARAIGGVAGMEKG